MAPFAAEALERSHVQVGDKILVKLVDGDSAERSDPGAAGFVNDSLHELRWDAALADVQRRQTGQHREQCLDAARVPYCN